jgi:bacillithiol system protein YtxJ
VFDAVRPLRDATELDEVLRAPLVVLYKHSSRCGISTMALLEVRHFAATHPDVPVYQIDVVAQRPLSKAIADRLGVKHASPQAILVVNGEAAWSATHFGVSADALQEALT